MKKFISYASLAILTVVLACKNPIDDFTLSLDPTFFDYVVEVNLEDVTGAEVSTSETYTIEVDGNTDYVYSINGDKNFEVANGLVQFIIAKGGEPTMDNPVNFNVKISSNRYRTVTLPVSVGLEEYYILETAALFDESNLPDGVDTDAGSGDASSGNLSTPVTVNAGTQDGSSQMDINISTTTEFRDASGAKLTGALEVKVLSFSDTSAAAQTTIAAITPQVVMINGVADTLGESRTPTFEIDMKVGGTEVKNFTQDSVGTRIALPAGFTKNDGTIAVPGDVIGLMSFSEGDAAWVQENDLVVKQDAQGLYVEPKLGHLSVYQVSRNKRGELPRVTGLRSILKTTGGDGSGSGRISFAYKYKTSATGKVYNYKTNERQVVITSPDRPRPASSRRHIVGLFSLEEVTVASATGDWSAWTITGPVIDVKPLGSSHDHVECTFTANKPVAPPVTIKFEMYCGTTKVNPPAGTFIYYRPASSTSEADYQLLHNFTAENRGDGSIDTYALTVGQSYDIKGVFGTEPAAVLEDQLLVEGKTYVQTLTTKQCDKIGL